MLKKLPITTLEDVIGCIGYKGPEKSLEDMKEAIKIGAQKSDPRPKAPNPL